METGRYCLYDRSDEGWGHHDAVFAVSGLVDRVDGDPLRRDAQSRVALVIGNSAYQNQTALRNPVTDANDMSAALRRLNFDVTTLTNANYETMRRAVIPFSQKANGAEIAVVFFAGHGVEIGGENYLIPVDAQLGTDRNVPDEAIALKRLTEAVSSSRKLGMVILDACRNNPFLPRMARTTLTRSVDRGLARVEPSKNILIAYAAREGTTADDGGGRNSPFTTALLKNTRIAGSRGRFVIPKSARTSDGGDGRRTAADHLQFARSGSDLSGPFPERRRKACSGGRSETGSGGESQAGS